MTARKTASRIVEPTRVVPAGLLSLLDVERGASLRAEASRSAGTIAREVAAGMTCAERQATAEYLREIASAVEFPDLPRFR